MQELKVKKKLYKISLFLSRLPEKTSRRKNSACLVRQNDYRRVVVYWKPRAFVEPNKKIQSVILVVIAGCWNSIIAVHSVNGMEKEYFINKYTNNIETNLHNLSTYILIDIFKIKIF